MGYFEGAIDYFSHVGGGYNGTAKGVDWHRGNETVCFDDNGTFADDLLVTHTADFLYRMGRAQNNAVQLGTASPPPFFLYLPFHLMHGPNQVTDRFLRLYPERNLSALAEDYGMCGVCGCASQKEGQYVMVMLQLNISLCPFMISHIFDGNL